ncbi:MAG TPA: TerC family protein [Alloacidobacterium sp.]|nr:TerC family protein [Alloacidobacterium sp.]
MEDWVIWAGFIAFVLVMFAVDLGILQRRAHTPTFRDSLIWSGVWVGLALLFNAGIYYWRGPEPAMQFLAGYLIEKSLSVDNLFVFIMIFSWFAVPKEHQHRVLLWGVLGALVMRAVFILGGVLLIQKAAWITYLFGALLLYTAWKLLRSAGQKHDGSNLIIRLASRLLPVTNSYDGQRLISRQEGVWKATPLLLVILIVEATDVMFAIDSIPAIFAVTQDPLIVFTSNVFAILGLRALYFVLAGFLDRLHYLKHGLAAILAFVGIKMLVAHHYPVPVFVSLGVILFILALSSVASILHLRRFGKDGQKRASLREG